MKENIASYRVPLTESSAGELAATLREYPDHALRLDDYWLHVDAEDRQRRLFIDTDCYGNPGVWKHLPDRPSAPQPVLAAFDVKDQDLWNAIVALVEGGEVA